MSVQKMIRHCRASSALGDHRLDVDAGGPRERKAGWPEDRCEPQVEAPPGRNQANQPHTEARETELDLERAVGQPMNAAAFSWKTTWKRPL